MPIIDPFDKITDPFDRQVEKQTEQPFEDTEQQPNQMEALLQELIDGKIDDNRMGALRELSKRGRLREVAERPMSLAALNPEMALEVDGGDTDKPTDELSMVDALKKGASAFPSSAKNQIVSLYEAITSPAKTWEGIKALSKDIYKNQMEVALKDMGFEDPSQLKYKEGHILENIKETPALDAVVDDLEKTYGTYKGFKEAVAKDPARVMTDIASVVAPAVKAVEGVAIGSKLPSIAQKAGTISKGVALVEPITALTTATKQAVKRVSKLTGAKIPSLSPSGLYESATKMSTKIPQKERTRLANVALESGIMPTIKGLDKIDEKIGTIDSAIADMIDKSVETGNKMPLGRLFKDFKKLKEDLRLSGKAKTGIKQLNNIRTSLLEANAQIKRGRLNPKEVQKLKKTIYKDLQGAYENMKNSTASIKGQKAVARAAKEYLEVLLPEIKQLNKSDSDLIKLRGALEAPVSRIRNHQLMGIGSGIKIGTGAGVGAASGSPELTALLTGLATAQSIFDHPRVKSRLAIVLDKLQKKGINISDDRAIKLMLAEKAIEGTQTEENK